MTKFKSAVGETADVVIVGSGFGGAVVACRLAQAGKSVIILEMGKELPDGRGETHIDEESSNDYVTSFGHFQIDRGTGMNVIRGTGVGGGSLHYYGVRLRTPEDIFDDPRWPQEITREVLNPYYDLAGDMLQAKSLERRDVAIPKRSQAFLDAADASGLLNTESEFNNPGFVPIAVNTSSESFETPSGEFQHPCIYCGECLIGCPLPGQGPNGDSNGNARALLTLNYLAVAQRYGAQIYPLHKVERIERIEKISADFDVHVESGTVHARQVVLAAGTLGSTEILLKSQKEQSLPTLSDMLGRNFSGNGDFLPTTIETKEDLEPSKAPTITVGGDFSTANNRIHIEDLGTIPSSEAVFGLKKKGANGEPQHEICYLGMGSDASNGTLRLNETEEGDRIHLNWDPTESIGLYNEITAAVTAMSKTDAIQGDYKDPVGYDPSTGEGLTTAHPLGGCVMGDDIERGVVNPKGEVYNVPGLFVADGAIVPSALSVNPSFTITALAERVAYWMTNETEEEMSEDNRPSNN